MPTEAQQQVMASYSTGELIKDIWGFLRPYRGRFLFASSSRLIGVLASLYPAIAFATLVTFISGYRQGISLHPIYIVFLLWSASVFLKGIGQFFSNNIGYNVAEKVDVDVSLKAIEHLFRLDIAWHEQENSGNKIKRIENGARALNDIIRMWFNNVIEITVSVVAINIIIFRFDHLIVLYLMVFLFVYFLISFSMRRKAVDAAYQVNIQDEQVHGLLFEGMNNIRTVKVMAIGTSILAIIRKATDELLHRVRVRIFWFQSRGALLTTIGNSCKVLISGVIFWGVLRGHYELGFLVLFNNYFSNLRVAIDDLSNMSQEFATNKIAVSRLKNILQEPIVIDDDRKKVLLPSDWKVIHFSKVAFAYGDHAVLRDVSFDVRRGEKIGIVGLSGAGKSTLFKLLLKEREEFSGDISFDDISLKKMKAQAYFKHVSVVLQDTEVFNFSLRDNITMTNSMQKTNDRLLKQAIKTAHISDFLSKLPQGLDTLIGEKGIKLSGGERQRLGIARAIFKQPELLLLDEATSHLDLESEEKIQDSLHDFFKNVTAIVIAHRLTTIKEMDRILVIEQGRIVEQGSFNELYKKKGRFYDVWEKQKL